MYFAKLPQKGDKVRMYVTIDEPSTVLDVFPYTGRYTDSFTHVMRYTSHIRPSGFGEIAITVGEVQDTN